MTAESSVLAGPRVPHTVATASFNTVATDENNFDLYIIAATVVAHVFAAAVAAHKASPSWLLPSYIYAAGSSAHRHPPPGRYQV